MESILTFRQLAALWKADKQHYVKRSTFSVYSLHLETHLIPSFGDLTDISELQVQQFVNQSLANGLKQKTIKDILIVLNMVLHFGEKYYSWTHYPMDIHFPTSCIGRDLPVLSIEEQDRLMLYLERHFSLQNLGIALCLSTGMRIGEICALTWEDIDLAEGVVRVCKTLQRISLEGGHTQLIVDSPKTSHSFREIPLLASLVKALKPLVRKTRPQYYVLTNRSKPSEPSTFRTYYKRLMQELHLPPIRFHGLRHSFATRCIAFQCDYKTVSALLGHASINTTLNLYVHPNLDQKRKCLNMVFRHRESFSGYDAP